MFRKKIRRIFSIILAAAISVLLLSGCNKQEDVVMPEIVFVTVNHFTTDKKIIDGEYVDAEPYIKTKGYFINNKGEIKYFEFEDETFLKKIELEDMSISMDKYFKNRNLYSLHKKISENYYDTEYTTVSEENIKKNYRSLLKIDNTSNLTYELSQSNIVVGLTIFYGVKLNNSGDEEFVLINESGNSYYELDNPEAKSLHGILNDIFPKLS